MCIDCSKEKRRTRVNYSFVEAIIAILVLNGVEIPPLPSSGKAHHRHRLLPVALKLRLDLCWSTPASPKICSADNSIHSIPPWIPMSDDTLQIYQTLLPHLSRSQFKLSLYFFFLTSNCLPYTETFLHSCSYSELKWMAALRSAKDGGI
ncbi:hypothetical protein L1887_36984 [Cichorium endivia]|nr:hypothetical protein L1887_36984 [Cichorium endivia]